MVRAQKVGNGTAPDCQLVCSSIPQGAVLGLVLFRIFVNDTSAGTGHTIKKFAADTSIVPAHGEGHRTGWYVLGWVPSNPNLSMVLQVMGQSALQRDLEVLEHWIINSNLTNGNAVQLHQGWTHARHKYKLGEEYLESSSAKRNVTGSVWARCVPWQPS